jgi:hypothetical protein
LKPEEGISSTKNRIPDNQTSRKAKPPVRTRRKAAGLRSVRWPSYRRKTFGEFGFFLALVKGGETAGRQREIRGGVAMKCTRYLYGAVLVCLLCLVAVHSWADPVTCRENEVGVTIIKENGTVKELCVGPPDLDHIGETSDEVIRAVCPCFSVEGVENLVDPAMDTTGCNYEPLDACFDDAYTAMYVHGCATTVKPWIMGSHWMAAEDHPIGRRWCFVYSGRFAIEPWMKVMKFDISSDEVVACQAIIMASKWWERCTEFLP